MLTLNTIQAQRIMQAQAYLNDISIIETTIRLMDSDGVVTSVEIAGNTLTIIQGLRTREFYRTHEEFSTKYNVTSDM